MIRARALFDDVVTTVAAFRTRAGRRLGHWAVTVPFRLAVAAFCLGVQLFFVVHSGARFKVPFDVAPEAPPHFRDPARDWAPVNWKRLVVSRWDSGNYIALGLRGYQYCPPRGPTLPIHAPGCNLAFYPTYGLLGRYLGRLLGIPIDFAMWAISLASAFVFLYLWTGKELTARLGIAETYVALLCLNAYTTGYCLVTVQTEPLTLALALGAFVAFARGRHLASAVLAGATSGVRITGIAIGFACAIGLLVKFWFDRPRTVWGAVRTLLLCGLCAWGELALMAYHLHRFGDPRAYLHAHAILFKHDPSLLSALWPDPAWLVRAIEFPLHEGIWFAAALLWFALGHRAALRRFPREQQAFWYVTFLATLGIATVGMLPIALAGMSRYLLLALPMFFAMGAVLRPRPLVLVLWVVMSGWHYWNVDLCTYTGGMGAHVLHVCNGRP